MKKFIVLMLASTNLYAGMELELCHHLRDTEIKIAEKAQADILNREEFNKSSIFLESLRVYMSSNSCNDTIIAKQKYCEDLDIQRDESYDLMAGATRAKFQSPIKEDEGKEFPLTIEEYRNSYVEKRAQYEAECSDQK